MRLTTLFLLAAVFVLIVPMNLYGQGQISPNPNPAGQTIILGTSGWYNNADPFTNKGTVEILKDGELTNNDGKTLTNDGTIDNYGNLWNDGIINNANRLNVEELLSNSATLNNNGWLQIDGTLWNYDTLTNNGYINVEGCFSVEDGATFYNNDTLDNYGEFAVNTGGTMHNKAQRFNNSIHMFVGGTLVLHSGTELVTFNQLVNSGTLINQEGSSMKVMFGVLYNEQHGTLYNDGTLINTADGTLTNNGTIDSSNGTFTNDGKLNGDGKIIGPSSDEGILAAGIDSAGVLTFDGDLSKTGGSKEIELGGLLDGGDDKSLTEFDWIDVTGNVELAGLLNVSLIDGFELHRGNTFEFLRVGGTLTGQYDGLDEGDLVGNFGGEDLFITYTAGDGNDVALYTNPVPEPTTLLLALLALVAAPLRVRCG